MHSLVSLVSRGEGYKGVAPENTLDGIKGLESTSANYYVRLFVITRQLSMCILLSWDRTYQNTCLYYSYLHNFKCNVYNSIKMMPGNAVQMGFIFFILHGNKSYLFKTWKAFWSSANGFCLYILISMNVSLIYVHNSKVNIWHLVNAKMSGKNPTVHQCDKLIRNMASRLENKISITWILFNSFILSNFFQMERLTTHSPTKASYLWGSVY